MGLYTRRKKNKCFFDTGCSRYMTRNASQIGEISVCSLRFFTFQLFHNCASFTVRVVLVIITSRHRWYQNPQEIVEGSLFSLCFANENSLNTQHQSLWDQIDQKLDLDKLRNQIRFPLCRGWKRSMHHSGLICSHFIFLKKKSSFSSQFHNFILENEILFNRMTNKTMIFATIRIVVLLASSGRFVSGNSIIPAFIISSNISRTS